MNWLESLSLKSKFTWMVWGPLAALLLVVATGFAERTQSVIERHQAPELRQLISQSVALMQSLQKYRALLIVGESSSVERKSQQLATERGIEQWHQALYQWLGPLESGQTREQQLQHRPLVELYQKLEQLPWLTQAWALERVNQPQLLGHYQSTIASLIALIGRLPSGVDANAVVNRGSALVAISQAHERLSQLAIASNSQIKQRLLAEFNLYLEQYKSRLTPKSVGVGSDRPIRALAPLTATQLADANMMRQRLQFSSQHLSLQNTWFQWELTHLWRQTLESFWQYLVFSMLLLMATARLSFMLYQDLYGRIFGLHRAVRALEAQRNYLISLPTKDGDELDQMAANLNRVIRHASEMQLELQGHRHRVRAEEAERVKQAAAPLTLVSSGDV